MIGNEGGGHVRSSLTGVKVGVDVSGTEKVWRTFQAIGDIAFAYAFSPVLIEIQATHLSSILSNIYLLAISTIYIYTLISLSIYINSHLSLYIYTLILIHPIELM
jgi:hypothetical protein